MKELLPVGLFGPDWFEVEPDELVDIGNAGKETIKYIRSDLVQKQIGEAVMKERERCLKHIGHLGASWIKHETRKELTGALTAIRNGEES